MAATKDGATQTTQISAHVTNLDQHNKKKQEGAGQPHSQAAQQPTAQPNNQPSSPTNQMSATKQGRGPTAERTTNSANESRTQVT